MRIGIDFDNTIACYDGVFHQAALERGLIPADLGRDKNTVRDHLNGSGRKDDFTELQGYVYGARMELVSPYPGFAEFMRRDTGPTVRPIENTPPEADGDLQTTDTAPANATP